MCVYNLVVLCITWAPASRTLVFFSRPANCISIVLLNIIFLFFWQNKVMMTMLVEFVTLCKFFVRVQPAVCTVQTVTE